MVNLEPPVVTSGRITGLAIGVRRGTLRRRESTTEGREPKAGLETG
ncbi:hypothetical protein SCANM124S_01026 [Streptomyces canus]